jgi:hypothetical protein
MQKIGSRFLWLVPALFVSLCPLALHAQESAAQGKAEHKPAHHQNVNVTGCLQKGDEPKEFSIVGEDGKTWDLRSRSVNLAEHLGHTVTVTGVRHHESKAEEAKEAKMEKGAAGAKENSELHVTGLKMIKDSCSK